MAFFRFVTMHAFDRQTDGRMDRNLIARPRLHSMQHGKNRLPPKKNLGKFPFDKYLNLHTPTQ